MKWLVTSWRREMFGGTEGEAFRRGEGGERTELRRGEGGRGEQREKGRRGGDGWEEE